MVSHEERLEKAKQYKYSLVKKGVEFPDVYFPDRLPDKIFNKAKAKYAPTLDRASVLVLIDMSMNNNGTSGIIFTDEKLYFSEILSKPKKIWYDEIAEISLKYYGKKKEENLFFKFKDGSTFNWYEPSLDFKAVKSFLQDLISMSDSVQTFQNIDMQFRNEFTPGIDAGGIQAGAYGTVNKVYDEEKFHARQGSGFAAERANNLYDNLTGKKSEIVGDNNVKNGADRVLTNADGSMTWIQSKYCATGKRCINNCFDADGKFRYIDGNGNPMVIEVPHDEAIYNEAIAQMRERIQEGKVPGITDPDKAEDLVKRGHFTYKQALNIAKAGTVESIVYDSVNGVIISTSAFGITAVLSFATSLWNGDDFDIAIKAATVNGLKVGGTAFITSVLASQLSKAGLNSLLVSSSETVIKILGPKASAVLINAFRSGAKIYGAAAMKSAAKLLRGNVITSGVTVLVLCTGDIISIFKGEMSGGQLTKNILNNVATVAGGGAGYLGGAALGSLIMPGIGTIVGGIGGAIIGGEAIGKLTNAVLSLFIGEDADVMVEYIQKAFVKLAEEYLVNGSEAEKISDAISKKINAKTLKKMYAASNSYTYALDLLTPSFDAQVKKRHFVNVPSEDAMQAGLISVLEDISDELSLANA